MTLRLALTAALLLAVAATASADSKREALWAAVRSGDEKAIREALDKGADVNAKNEYGVTALWIAVGKAKPEVIEQLIKAGADVNARDDIWYNTPLSSAVGSRQQKIVEMLIKAGAKDTDAAFYSAATTGNLTMTQAILDQVKTVGQETLDAALYATTGSDMKAKLEKAGAKPLAKADEKDRKEWEKLAGAYEGDGGMKMTIAVKDVGLVIGGRVLKATGPDTFVAVGPPGTGLRVERKNGEVSRLWMQRFTAEYGLYKFKEPTVKPVVSVAGPEGSAIKPSNWPSFRGLDGTGVADGQHPPVTFNGKKNENVRWKADIPGLGHSCPVVWGDRVFLTTALSSGQPEQKIRVGNYGDVGSVDDSSKHTWQLICLDRDSGKILWTKTPYEGTPKIKRHLKGSQANCTVATDGQHVVACFGSEGLFCYDFSGKQLWKRDMSTLDSAFALDKEYEWGFGNSPVLHDGLCILQCDLSRDSFIAAFSLSNGEKVWSTPRDEIPSWSSPVVWKNKVRTEIVTNAAQYARGYDPKTGVELWRLAKKSEVTVPTPVLGADLAFVCSGNRPIQPIIAIKPGATGDISLKDGEKANKFVAWGTMRGGPYMPTPILYGDYFYTCSNSGVLACYEAKTGQEVYKERTGGPASISYTASPVAADGRIYLTSEQGEVRVVKAGPTFELLAVNEVGDLCMPTPAIANGMLFVRSQKHLWAFGAK